MLRIKNFCKICLASSLLLSCVEQKLQQVAVSSPQTNIGGGNVNGNQVNVGGNSGDIKTGDKSQINVGGNASVTVNKPAPLIDSVNITGNDPRIFKMKFVLGLTDGSNSEISYTYLLSEEVFRGYSDIKIEIIGKNFDSNNLEVYSVFNLPMLVDESKLTPFKAKFEVLEKNNTRILLKFPSNIDFPKPSKEILNEKFKNRLQQLISSAIPGGNNLIDYFNQYNFRIPAYCYNEWGHQAIPTNGIFVETNSGRVFFSRGFNIYPEIPKDNLNEFIYNCFVYPEISEKLMNKLSYELKNITYDNGNGIEIPIPLPTKSPNDQGYLPLKYIQPTPIPVATPTIAP